MRRGELLAGQNAQPGMGGLSRRFTLPYPENGGVPDACNFLPGTCIPDRAVILDSVMAFVVPRARTTPGNTHLLRDRNQREVLDLATHMDRGAVLPGMMEQLDHETGNPRWMEHSVVAGIAWVCRTLLAVDEPGKPVAAGRNQQRVQ